MYFQKTNLIKPNLLKTETLFLQGLNFKGVVIMLNQIVLDLPTGEINPVETEEVTEALNEALVLIYVGSLDFLLAQTRTGTKHKLCTCSKTNGDTLYICVCHWQEVERVCFQDLNLLVMNTIKRFGLANLPISINYITTEMSMPDCFDSQRTLRFRIPKRSDAQC